MGGVLAALGFCIYALIQSGEFLFLDNVNLPFHEFGHLFFSIFGETIGIWGGTLMQLIIPFSILVYFFVSRETTGVFFCAFWLGENLLNIGVYIVKIKHLPDSQSLIERDVTPPVYTWS